MIAGVVVASEGVVGWVRVKVTRGVLAGLAPRITGLPWEESKREGEMAPRMEVTVWKVMPSSTTTFSIFCLLEVMTMFIQSTFEGRLWHGDDIEPFWRFPVTGLCVYWPKTAPSMSLHICPGLAPPFPLFPAVSSSVCRIQSKSHQLEPSNSDRNLMRSRILWSQKYFSLNVCIFYKEGKGKLSVEKSDREQLSLVNKKHHR